MADNNAMNWIDAVKWDAAGLVPVIAQEHAAGGEAAKEHAAGGEHELLEPEGGWQR